MAFTYHIVIKQYGVFRSFQIILQFKFYNKSYLASLHWSVQVFKLLQLFAIKVSSMLLNRGVWIVMKNELAHLLRFLNRMADLETLKSISFCITVTTFNIKWLTFVISHPVIINNVISTDRSCPVKLYTWIIHQPDHGTPGCIRRWNIFTKNWKHLFWSTISNVLIDASFTVGLILTIPDI